MAIAIKQQKSFMRYITMPNALLASAWLLCVAIGAVPQQGTLLAVALFGILLLAWRYDEFYMLAFVFLFFMEQFYLTSTQTTFRMFTYMAVVKFFFEIPKVKFRVFFFPAVAVFALFSIFGIGDLSMRLGLTCLTDMIIAYIVLVRLAQDEQKLRKALTFFVFIGIAAGIYSLLANNVIEYAVGRNSVRSEEIIRYCATFDDANYAGLFYNVLIFTTLCLSSLKKWYVKVPILLALHYFLLLTNSMTALLAYAMCWCIYIVLRFPKQSPIVLSIAAIAGIAAIAIAWNVPQIREIDFVNNVIIRVNEQLRYLQSGRFDMFTSDRTYIWTYFLDIFNRQDILGKLFGGNVVTAIAVDNVFTLYKACHQVYLQGMLNFGIIGAIIVFATIICRGIYRVYRYFTHFIHTKTADLHRITIIVIALWMAFGLSIDYFLDWRFIFLFFL